MRNTPSGKLQAGTASVITKSHEGCCNEDNRHRLGKNKNDQADHNAEIGDTNGVSAENFGKIFEEQITNSTRQGIDRKRGPGDCSRSEPFVNYVGRYAGVECIQDSYIK